MDEEQEVNDVEAGESIGAQLKAAREAKGLSIDEMASKSRIPKRHLENLEADNWEKLPAATYAAGFAKSHAAMTGMDGDWAAQAVREQMGAFVPKHETSGVYEVADQKRGMPGWVIIVAIIAIVAAILLFSWMNDRRLVAEETASEAVAENDETEAEVPSENDASDTPSVSANAPVTLVASRAVWMRITDGDEVLFARELAAGETYRIPASATAPMLETARPASLRAQVEGRSYAFQGEDGTRIEDVSLLARDVAQGPSQAATATARREAAPAPTTRQAPTTAPAPRRQPAPTPAPAPEPEPTPPPAPTPTAAAEAPAATQDADEAAPSDPPPPPADPAPSDDSEAASGDQG